MLEVLNRVVRVIYFNTSKSSETLMSRFTIKKNNGIPPPMISECFELLNMQDAAKQIESSQIICIWGMSLGATDSVWWEKINEWLGKNASHHLIIFWHTKKPPNGKSIYLYYSEKSRVIEQMMSYSSFTREQINKISNQIHVIYNTKKVLRVSFKKEEVINV